MIIPISYPLVTTSPLYPGTPAVSVQPFKSIKKGDSTNSSILSLHSHSGTHVDLPPHFCDTATVFYDLFSEKNALYPSYCVNLPMNEPHEISPKELQKIPTTIQKTAAALLVRTGWWSKRDKDSSHYTGDHPWISEEVPDYLREMYPHLQLFGLDLISISSPLHRDRGRECHRRFLCAEPPLLLLEDANLSDERLTKGAYILHLFPYLVDNPDGFPVVAIMERK